MKGSIYITDTEKATLKYDGFHLSECSISIQVNAKKPSDISDIIRELESIKESLKH